MSASELRDLTKELIQKNLGFAMVQGGLEGLQRLTEVASSFDFMAGLDDADEDTKRQANEILDYMFNAIDELRVNARAVLGGAEDMSTEKIKKSDETTEETEEVKTDGKETTEESIPEPEEKEEVKEPEVKEEIEAKPTKEPIKDETQVIVGSRDWDKLRIEMKDMKATLLGIVDLLTDVSED